MLTPKPHDPGTSPAGAREKEVSTNYDALIRAAGNATASDYGSEGATWDWLAYRIREGARTRYWIALTAALLAGVGAL